MDLILDDEFHNIAVDEEGYPLTSKDDDDEDDCALETQREDLIINLPSENLKKMEDIVKDNVLPFLPAKSLSKFKAVSKEWNYRISLPLLAHEQSYHFKELSGFFVQSRSNLIPSFVTLNKECYGVPSPDLGFLLPTHAESNGTTILSSCNGLLLCQVSSDCSTSLCVCNPFTKHCKQIPEMEYGNGFRTAMVLAFDPSLSNIEGNYRIVCAVDGITAIFFEIYSSEKGSWTESKVASVELGGSIFAGGGYYIDGRCYWVTEERKVLAYDLKYDVYSIINIGTESPRNGILALIRGELSYVVSDPYGECVLIFGGTMDMGLRQRKRMELDINGEEIIRGPFRVLSYCVDDGTMLFLSGSVVYSYNSREGNVEVKCEVGADVSDNVEESSVRFLPYINSLASVA